MPVFEPSSFLAVAIAAAVTELHALQRKITGTGVIVVPPSRKASVVALIMLMATEPVDTCLRRPCP